MLLRGSGEFNLESVMNEEVDSGVEHGTLIRGMVDEAIAGNWVRLAELRESAIAAMGVENMVDVFAVMSSFNGITRIADSIGIPLDEGPDERTAKMRDEMGIDVFHYDSKSMQYDSRSA